MTDTNCAELEQLRNEVAALRLNIELLRAELAREVRTESLVVVHPDDGHELITTKVRATSVSLQVAWLPSSDPRYASAVLTAGVDEEGDTTGTADVYVAGPNTCGQLMCTNRTLEQGSHSVGEYTSLSLESDKWRDAALGKPEVGPTSVHLDHTGMRFGKSS